MKCRAFFERLHLGAHRAVPSMCLTWQVRIESGADFEPIRKCQPFARRTAINCHANPRRLAWRWKYWGNA